MTKSKILNEIKRIAKENGGKPPGAQSFATFTGIKKGDWYGKYWARWGDALREAGYDANQLQSAYDTEFLLKKYAQLAMELGRLPTSGEIRLKGHEDPELPAEMTFTVRLGNKRKIVEKLREYCVGREGFHEVLRLCETYAPPRRDAVDESVSGDDTVGFVYLVKSGKFYKIGMTNAPGRREYELDLQLPEPVTRVHVIRTDDPAGIEAYWHNRFGAKRKKGEWFALDAKDVAAFKRRRFM